MSKKLFFSVLAILLISGCVNFGGANQANVDTTNIITLTPASISVIPKPPISVSTPFTVTFEIKNQEKQKQIESTVQLFDWGVCSNVKLDCAADKVDKTKCTFKLVPQQTELVEVSAKAPSSEEIGGISATCPIQWRASYTMDATTSGAGFNVVSRSHLTELQRAGKSVDLPPTSSNIGTGPVKPYITFNAPEGYVVSGAPIQMKVQVRDQGEGTFSQIGAGLLSITVPTAWYEALEDQTNACTENFKIDESVQGSTTTFKNKEAIPLISKQTPELVCNFKAPDLGSNVPQKSYTVQAKLTGYTYSIDGKQVVEIKP